jgi:hypothetical protein
MADKDKTKKTKKTTARQYVIEAGYAMELINSDPSLQEWIRRVRKYMKDNDGRTPTEYEMDELKDGIVWFEKYNADQELARMQQADPRRQADWARSLELAQQKVQALANTYGINLDADEVRTIATDVRLNQLTDIEIKERFAPILSEALIAGEDIGGQAAEFERNILQWSRINGLTLTGDIISKYVSAGVEGRSSLEDIKNDLRRTYIAGAYPGWSDKINAGQDIYDIAAPYRSLIANGLEESEDNITLDDPLMKKIFQAVGPDGKPRIVPMYEAEQMMRLDPRWDLTNNAYDVYSRVGENLLRTFGFR